MQVKGTAECSPLELSAIVLTFISYHLSLRSLFCLFLSGLFTQVLLYHVFENIMENEAFALLEQMLHFP